MPGRHHRPLLNFLFGKTLPDVKSPHCEYYQKEIPDVSSQGGRHVNAPQTTPRSCFENCGVSHFSFWIAGSIDCSYSGVYWLCRCSVWHQHRLCINSRYQLLVLGFPRNWMKFVPIQTPIEIVGFLGVYFIIVWVVSLQNGVFRQQPEQALQGTDRRMVDLLDYGMFSFLSTSQWLTCCWPFLLLGGLCHRHEFVRIRPGSFQYVVSSQLLKCNWDPRPDNFLQRWRCCYPRLLDCTRFGWTEQDHDSVYSHRYLWHRVFRWRSFCLHAWWESGPEEISSVGDGFYVCWYTA